MIEIERMTERDAYGEVPSEKGFRKVSGLWMHDTERERHTRREILI